VTPDALIADLQSPWRHGEHLDARDLVLEGPLVLDGMTLRGVDFTGAHFKSGLSARGATFRGLAWFRDVRVDGDCDFSDARFTIDLRADGMWVKSLSLDRAQVRGVLALARVHAEQVSAANALILANLTLEGADVARTLNLTNTEIMGGFWADRGRFGRVLGDGADLHGRRRNWDALIA